MSGKHGGVQKLLQNKLDRKIPLIHCFKHQLHLVVIHAMSFEAAIEDFFRLTCCTTSSGSQPWLFCTKARP